MKNTHQSTNGIWQDKRILFHVGPKGSWYMLAQKNSIMCWSIWGLVICHDKRNLFPIGLKGSCYLLAQNISIPCYLLAQNISIPCWSKGHIILSVRTKGIYSLLVQKGNLFLFSQRSYYLICQNKREYSLASKWNLVQHWYLPWQSKRVLLL